MSMTAFILSGFGCSKKTDNTQRSQEELSSVSISQSHMDRTYCYTFWARESDGGFFLDANCLDVDYDNNDCREIDFSDREIAREDFEKFSELDSKYDFLSNKKQRIQKDPIFFTCDETITSFSVKYGENSFALETNGELYSAVHEYFFELAKKYDDNSK